MNRPSVRLPLILFALLPLLTILPAFADPTDAGGKEGADDPFAHLEWRSIGPVNMSGRVSDVEGVPGDPRVVYVGAASGGVWKSTDGGVTFAPIFDEQPIASIGDLALAPSNPEVVYVGTGESNVRNSVSFGDGVYKSTDGGASWRHVGLGGSRHVSRMAVHPTDPDTVYAGVLGNVFGPSEERGVYRSRDGGATWERVLYLDDRHGVADLDLDPKNPNVLFAALWRFERKPWTFRSGGDEGGVYRSVDGGDSWEKLTDGLPETMGRIGVKVAPSNPEVVYVIAESNDGILFRSDDRGDTFRQVSDEVSLVSRGFYYADLRVDPTDPDRVYAVASVLSRSIDGGETFERIARNVHIDFHALWIDPEEPGRMWVGEDGGVAVTYDRGESWEPVRNLPIGQFYQVFHDSREPFYYLGGGLQDNGTWYGPSRTREPSGILPDDWRMLSFGDAYWVVPHPEVVDVFLSEYQAGGILRTDMRTRRQLDVNPQPRRNDGGPAEGLEFRFNWNAPIVASPHDPNKVYFAGNVVFESTDFGDSWRAISPDLTTDDPAKQGTAGGPVWPENTTAEYHCTIISFAESPVEPGVLWAGTDDGNLQLSRDGGESWTNVVDNVGVGDVGVPADSPVSHVEPSRTAAGTAYAAFDRHMLDDFRPHVYKTTDFGASWQRITDGLGEQAWVWVVREDPKNPDLLYAGTELGLYASFDAGDSWRKLHLGNLPTVAVHDVLIHPRENDLILGTHGRAIYVFDDATPLQRWSEVPDGAAAHLFDLRPAIRFPTRFTRYGLGDKVWVAPNPPYGALVTYYLRESLDSGATEAEGEGEEGGGEEETEKEERIRIEILDAAGEVIRTLDEEPLPTEAGLHRVSWNLAMEPPRKRSDDEEESDFGPPPRGPEVLPGVYTVRLTVDGESWERDVEVGVDPTVVVSRDELEEQLRVAEGTWKMRSGVADALRGHDALEAQLAERRETLEKLGREPAEELEESWQRLEEALAEHRDAFTKDPEKPYWSQGPRLAQRLGELFGNVDTAFAAPTAAQQGYFRELRDEYRRAVEGWNRFLAEEVAAWNAAAEAAGVPTLAVPEPVSVE